MSSTDDKDPAKLLEALLSQGGVDKNMSLEEIQKRLEEQEKEIISNFKKLETKDIIKMLVAAENYISVVQRSNPSLTKKNHMALDNAKVLVSCILDGKKPDNFDELGPKF